MKKKGLFYVSLFIYCFASAQVADKNLNIYTGYSIGSFSGKEMSNDDGFIYPYLYSNLTNLNGYSFKATYKIYPLFSFGLENGKMTGNNWSSENSKIYKDATVNLKSFSPVFQIHTRFKESGIFNRLKIYG
ncbi:MAG: hypothetical protein JXR31_01470, partial [Prolixibacteraceae bacterium]|nr:hypothetical protein [Prolixibacteraceae bacterium]